MLPVVDKAAQPQLIFFGYNVHFVNDKHRCLMIDYAPLRGVTEDAAFDYVCELTRDWQFVI